MEAEDGPVITRVETGDGISSSDVGSTADSPRSQDFQDISASLAGWHLAKEAATRANRNLIQYGGAAAAILGIQGASTGLFAISTSLMKNVGQAGLPLEARLIIWGLIIANTILFMVFAVVSVHAYLARQQQEQNSDQYLGDLIRKGYMPSEQGIDQIIVSKN